MEGSDDTVMVGAFLGDVGFNPDHGAAYVFTGTGGIWTEQGATYVIGGSSMDPTTNRVRIDVKPGDEVNRIRTSGTESIAAAALTTATFDATTIDPSSVCLGDDPPAGGTTSYNQPAGVDADCNEAHRRAHIEDADGDGDLDMVFDFEAAETGIDAGDTEAWLTGRTTGGTSLAGSDSIRTVP